MSVGIPQGSNELSGKKGPKLPPDENSRRLSLIGFVWPRLEEWKPYELMEIRHENFEEVDDIKKVVWTINADAALAEARRIAAEEDERRRSVEAKSSTYLLVAAALIPLLTYLESAIWDNRVGTAPKWLTLTLLMIAVAYLAGAAFWAFRTVGVSVVHRVGTRDVVIIWGKDKDQVPHLVQETLIAARRNRGLTNAKVSAFKMSHEFIIRAVFTFCALLLVQALWELYFVIAPLRAFIS